MARSMVGFNVDTEGANYVAGFMEQLSIRFGDNQNMNPVLNLTHGIMEEQFIDHMSTLALANPSAYHHVYEWGRVGDPTARLWDDVLIGKGTVRQATFRWRPSKSVVPVTAEAEEVGVQEIHVFIWKAPIMEYSQDITINPHTENGISYFTGPANTNDWELKWFRGPVHVRDPGGPYVKGAFTQAYTLWWAGGGAALAWETTAKPILAATYGAAAFGKAIRPKRYSSKAKVAAIAMNTNPRAAVAQGKAAAEKFMRKNAADIAALAERYRERNANL